MKTAGRLQAAIEVLEDILLRHRPAAMALADWGKSHRFAGSADRSAIGNLVYDALRRRLSLSHRMAADTPRALVLATAATSLGVSLAEICAAVDGSRHAPAALTPAESHSLPALPRDVAPDFVAADIPGWLAPAFRDVFGDNVIDEGAALARRAPVDLRVNTLVARRDAVLDALAHAGPQPGPWTSTCIRIPPPEGAGRTPNVEVEGAHGQGAYEVQDQGSQIAAALVGARPDDKVLDLCAGAGGKTLALAAAMENSGSLLAYDADKSRLRPIYERITRARATCITVLPAADRKSLETHRGSFDVVVVDAPCSGTGVWRRRPDSKWRLKPEALAQREASQRNLLDQAADFVRPGGRIVYITCSVLPQENSRQIEAFLQRHQGFRQQPWRQRWSQTIGQPTPEGSADGRDDSLLLTPRLHDTDGFFIACLGKN